jgi:hypothetical protein
MCLIGLVNGLHAYAARMARACKIPGLAQKIMCCFIFWVVMVPVFGGLLLNGGLLIGGRFAVSRFMGFSVF